MKRIEAGGAIFNVLDRGSGPPLLLVHSFPCDHGMWHAQVEHFSPRFRVIAPDLRGFGQSSLGRPAKTATTMQHMADDLVQLLDALEVRQSVVFCGVSMGGYIGFEFLERYPDRLRAMIFSDTKASSDTPDAAAARVKTAEGLLRDGTAPLAEVMLPRLLARDTFAQLPGAVEFLRQRILAASPQGLAAACLGMAQRADFSDKLSQIRMPTLVVVGEQDVITPPDEMQAMARGISGSRFQTIPHAGHMAALEQPAAFNAALDAFLNSPPV